MVLYKPGEVIAECYPFAHCIDSSFVERGCHYCLKESSSLQKCSKCKVARYCNPECQSKDWKNVHKNECQVFRRNSSQSRNDLLENNSIRLALRTLLILQQRPEKAFEEVATYNGKRSFNSLLSHSEEICKQTFKCTMLKKIWFDSFRPLNVDWEDFLEIYGKVTINSFQMSEFMGSDGAGLFIASSVFDHSCLPNSIQVFDGLKMQVRAIKEFDTQIEAPVIDYCTQYLPRKVKQKILENHYFFKCQCILCLTPDEQRDDDMERLKILSDKLFSAKDDYENLMVGARFLDLHLKYFPKPSLSLTMTYFDLTSTCHALKDERLPFYAKKLFDNMHITHGTEHSLWKKLFGEGFYSFSEVFSSPQNISKSIQ